MSHPRRILFVTESFGVGGTEKHLCELLPALKARRFEVGAFCFTETGSRAAELAASDIPITAAPEFGAMLLRVARGAVALRHLIKCWRPTIAHFFLPRPYLAGAPVAIASGVPIKVMSRRSLSDYQRNWPGAATLERLLHRRMDAVLGNARAVIDELKEEGCPEIQVHLIYNGIRMPDPRSTRAEARAALGLSQDAFVAVVIANLFPYKGHRELIGALKNIAGKLPESWLVLCAGRDAGAGRDIAQAIDTNGLHDHVRLLGERTDVPLLLKAADIGISPTRKEGFSNAVLESMAAGLPIVVTDVGGNAEAVTDAETGFVVSPQDPDALGNAILRLAHDPQLRRTMGDQARARVAANFSFPISVQKYVDLYERLLAHKCSE